MCYCEGTESPISSRDIIHTYIHISKLEAKKRTLKLEGNYMHDMLHIDASKSVLLK